MLVRLPASGNVLLAADAVMHRSMSDAETRIIFVTDKDDEPTIRLSIQKISDVARREAALVVYGHDPQQWPTLRTLHFSMKSRCQYPGRPTPKALPFEGVDKHHLSPSARQMSGFGIWWRYDERPNWGRKAAICEFVPDVRNKLKKRSHKGKQAFNRSNKSKIVGRIGIL